MTHFVNRFKHNLNRVRAELEPRRRSPDELLGELLHDVQFRRLYPDSMAFVDMVPTNQLKAILKAYRLQRHEPGFDLQEFIARNFANPALEQTYTTNPEHSVEEHIHELWAVLRREQYQSKGSLIGLPHPYIVAGGRFRSLYYWDSYFIMLGLAVDGEWELLEGMVKNFAFLLRKFGHIPNGNRTYYVGRSQPPFFALMVQLLANHKGKHVLVQYLPYLLLEHHFWMKGASKLGERKLANSRVVRLADGEVLNRYYDNKTTPRPEGYHEDVTVALQAGINLPSKVHVDLRAAAESGWDFSSRWCKDPANLATIHTTDLVPIDLNCLLMLLEQTIAEAYGYIRRHKTASRYRGMAEARAAAINKYCWDEKEGFYFDYDIVAKRRSTLPTAAASFALFAGVASPEQAERMVATLRKTLWQKGGIVSTPIETGQQWDSPNGWPPLQWITVQGLRNYGYHILADRLKVDWTATCMLSYQQTGKLVEKYNVLELYKAAGGGEYPLQDGFGWTNGVLLALLHEDAVHWK